MQVLRTILWVVLAVALVLFGISNWVPVEVRIWEGLLLETKLAALVIFAFLLGFVPAWMLYRATRWRLSRRIAALESTLAAQRPQPPIATTTQLESAQP